MLGQIIVDGVVRNIVKTNKTGSGLYIDSDSSSGRATSFHRGIPSRAVAGGRKFKTNGHTYQYVPLNI